MKTTIEFPDELIRAVKAKAAQDGVSLKGFITEALREKLGRQEEEHLEIWRKHFGSLSHLKKESRRIEKLIEEEFEKVDLEGWK